MHCQPTTDHQATDEAIRTTEFIGPSAEISYEIDLLVTSHYLQAISISTEMMEHLR